MYERRKCLWKKIKADQVIEESSVPIETEHGNLDPVPNTLLNENGYGKKYALRNIRMFIIEGMDKCSSLELLNLPKNLSLIADGICLW